MKSFQADAPADPGVVAHAASDSTGDRAAQVVDLAKKTGFDAQYVGANFDQVAKAQAKMEFEAQLKNAPVTTGWAAQSPDHAAAVQASAGPLAKLEKWYSDIGDAMGAGVLDIQHAEAMREFTGSGGPLADTALETERALSYYDSQEHGYGQQVARAVPQMALYGAGAALTGPIGVGGLLYAQNKGVLARQIQLSQPKEGGLSKDEIDKYATIGSAAVAVTLSGLLMPLIRSIPGVKSALQGAGATMLSRAASTTVGQAALRSILAWGGHTAMGATAMALQHVINTETAAKASGKDTDIGQLTREGTDAFVKALPVMATLATYGPARNFLFERGRLAMAPAERAQLDHMVEQAKQVEMSKTAPQRAAELFGLMGRGAKVFIDWQAAKRAKGLPPEAVAAAEASQDSVEVPLGEYLANMQDQHEALKDDVKMSADGATMNEARARDKELRAALPPDMAKALLGRQTPDEVLGFEQPETKGTAEEPTPPAGSTPGGARPMPEGAAETVKLFRGTGPERDPSQPGLGGARFMSPDPEVAKSYSKAGGKVAEETMNFQNVLRAGSRIEIGEKLGFKFDPEEVRTKDDALDNWADIVNKAREQGYDALAFKSVKGIEYVDLMNWLHEMVKQYGGDVEKWKDRLTPEFIAALKQEGSVGATSPQEHSRRVVEAMQVRDIDPERFERLAKKADKYIQEAAEKARSGSVAGAKASSPADVARLQTYELARDVNRAKAAQATAVLAELQTYFEKMSKQAGDQKLRAQLRLAGPPLLHLFDALTEGTSASKTKQGWVTAHNEAVEAGAHPFSTEATDYADAKMKGSLADVQQWMEESARPFLSASKFIEKFLADPKPWESLRPAEARAIADAVKQLTVAAREETILRRKDREATVAETVSEIRGELRENPSKGLPLPSGVPSTRWRDMKLSANAANAIQLRPKNNMRQKSVALQEAAFDRINDAIYVRDKYFREVGGQWKEAFDKVPAEVAKRRFETYDLSEKLPTQHLGQEPMKNVPRETLWELAAHRMSKGNMDRVTSVSGWDKHVIDEILFENPDTKLTVPEWDYLQSLADVNEKYVWTKLKEHGEKYYGQAPTKTAGVPFKVQLEDGSWKEYAGGYKPLKRDARPGVAPQPEPTKGIAQYWGRDFQVPWTPGSVKERVDGSHYLVNLDRETSRNTMAQTLHWLAFDQPVRDVAKLLNDPGLAADMNQYMGEGRADAVRGWLKTSATRQAQSVAEGQEVVGRMFGWQRRLALVGIVGGSQRLAVAQLSHPAGLMFGGEVNPVHGLPALLSIFKPLTMADGEVRLFPNWNDAVIHGEEVQHRADYAYNTLREGWDSARSTKFGPLGTLKDLALRTGRIYLHAVDRLTTTWAWTAFHSEAVAKGMEPFSREAIDYANGKTQDVMPVHDVETAAPVLTNRQLGGFLIMHGFKNTLYNMRQDALAKTAKDFNLAQTPAEKGGALAKAAGRVGLQVAMFGGFAIMGKLALGYGQQDDESKGEWLARDFLGGQSEDVPLIGGLGEPIAKWMLGGHVTKRDFTAYGNPGVAAVVKVQDMLGNLVNEGREDYKKVFDALETALFFGGVPSRPTRVGAEHIYEMLTGEDYGADDSDTTARFFYTERQWDSIKRTLTPDD
jgi:hypothetical protein